MVLNIFRRKKFKPLAEGEETALEPQNKQGWDSLKRIINPKDRDILVYYPGSGGETVQSRLFGAGIQVQVSAEYEHGNPNLPQEVIRRFRDEIRTAMFEHPEKREKYRTTHGSLVDFKRREYRVQWLEVVDYWGDAYNMIPEELNAGIDLLLTKCGVSVNNRKNIDYAFGSNANFKAALYNLIKEGAFQLDDSFTSRGGTFFEGFDPQIFGFVERYHRSEGIAIKQGPNGLTLYQKTKGLELPVEVFEADNLLKTAKEAKDKSPATAREIAERLDAVSSQDLRTRLLDYARGCF